MSAPATPEAARPVPLLRLEKAYMPSEKDIVEAARRAVTFA